MPFDQNSRIELQNDAALDNAYRTQAKRKFSRKLRWSRIVLLIERWWPTVWPPLAVTALFLFVSLIGLWANVPNWAHFTLLGLFGLAFVVSFAPMFLVRWPSAEEALRNIESKSGIPHRPASSYFDTMTLSETSGKTTKKLWQAHKDRMAQLLSRMTAGWPSPAMHKYDPYAIRALVILVLPIAFLWAGDGWRDRLGAAFRLPAIDVSSDLRVDAWVTPPLYTGKPPLLLTEKMAKSVVGAEGLKLTDVPEKSELIIRANGSDVESIQVAVRTLNGKDGDEGAVTTSTPPKSAAAGGKEVSEHKITIDTPMSVTVSDGRRTVFEWHFNAVKDSAPKISLAEKPKKTIRGALRIGYEVEDDYGVAEARALFSRPTFGQPGQSQLNVDNAEADEEHPEEYWAPLGEAPDLPLSLPSRNVKKGVGQTFKDLTSHPWAGLEVDMVLNAKDQAGQEARTEPTKLKLPEREFRKPFARAVIEQRKALVADPKNNRRKAALAIDALTTGAENFIKDKVVYLGLRSAHWRLNYEPTREGVQSVVDLLWDVALRIEDGNLSDAERALRLAQKNLERALREDASEQEIKKAIDALRTALSRYLQEMAKQQAENNLDGQTQENNLSENNLVSPQDLDQMLKNIENLAKSGSKEMAQQMLNQLQNMLENLQAGRPQQNGDQAQNMMNQMNELSELIQKQQKLLDDTYKRQRQGGDQQNARRGERSQGRRGQGQRAQQGQSRQQQGQRGRQGQQGQRGQMGQRGQQGQSGRMGQQGQSGQQGQRGQQGQFGQQFGQGQPGRQSPQGQMPGQQGPSGSQGALSDRQGDLRAQLEQMLQQLRSSGAKMPGALGEAGQAMGDAQGSLEQDQLGDATEQQTMALDRLRKGARSLAQQMMQSMMANGGRRGDRDPLGRRPQQSQGPDLGTSVKVPDEIDIQRARQILEELRRRLSEPTRPALELDYLERLLKRF